MYVCQSLLLNVYFHMTHPNAHCYLSNVSCTLENVLRGVIKQTFFFQNIIEMTEQMS